MNARMKPAEVEAALTQIPYAVFLGLKAELRGDELTLVLPFSDHLIGNPRIPALHGGAIGALMEITAVTQITIVQRSPRMPKTIDIGIDYLRPGRPADAFARARVSRLGRRIAHVQVEAWQFDRADPFAALHGHFLLSGEDT